MPLVLNEEQNMLKDAAKDFCTNSTPITQLRKLRDDKNDMGFDSATWLNLAGQALPFLKTLAVSALVLWA